jgi:hypothetical protein
MINKRGAMIIKGGCDDYQGGCDIQRHKKDLAAANSRAGYGNLACETHHEKKEKKERRKENN